MKTYIIFLGLLIISMPATLFAQAKKFTLKGKVGHISPPAKAYLIYKNKTMSRKDSVVVVDGAFSFTGKVDEPLEAHLMINKKGDGPYTRTQEHLAFYIEPGIIEMSSPGNLLIEADVKGGSLNLENAKLNSLLAPLQEKLKELNMEYSIAFRDKKMTQEFKDEIEPRFQKVDDEIKAVKFAYIKSNPDKLYSFFVLKNITGAVPDVDEVEPIYNSLSAKLRAIPLVKEYGENIVIWKKTALGVTAPDFTQADTAGKPVSLRDFKGKYVLIDFWASWCGPCRAENPNLLKAFNQYKDKGFTVLGVSLDKPEAKEKWLKAIHDDGLTWTQVSDLKFWKNEVAQLFAIQSIPQNFLISPDGKIVAKNLRGTALEKKLNEIFNDKVN